VSGYSQSGCKHADKTIKNKVEIHFCCGQMSKHQPRTENYPHGYAAGISFIINDCFPLALILMMFWQSAA
jgi:hypothetical protein